MENLIPLSTHLELLDPGMVRLLHPDCALVPEKPRLTLRNAISPRSTTNCSTWPLVADKTATQEELTPKPKMANTESPGKLS